MLRQALQIDVEAVLHLKVWDELDEIVKVFHLSILLPRKRKTQKCSGLRCHAGHSQESSFLGNSKVYEIFADMILAADAPANGEFSIISWASRIFLSNKRRYYLTVTFHGIEVRAPYFSSRVHSLCASRLNENELTFARSSWFCKPPAALTAQPRKQCLHRPAGYASSTSYPYAGPPPPERPT